MLSLRWFLSPASNFGVFFCHILCFVFRILPDCLIFWSKFEVLQLPNPLETLLSATLLLPMSHLFPPSYVISRCSDCRKWVSRAPSGWVQRVFLGYPWRWVLLPRAVFKRDYFCLSGPTADFFFCWDKCFIFGVVLNLPDNAGAIHRQIETGEANVRTVTNTSTFPVCCPPASGSRPAFIQPVALWRGYTVRQLRMCRHIPQQWPSQNLYGPTQLVWGIVVWNLLKQWFVFCCAVQDRSYSSWTGEYRFCTIPKSFLLASEIFAILLDTPHLFRSINICVNIW